MCRTFHTEGFCPYGKRCHFVHTPGPKEEMPAGSPPDQQQLPTKMVPQQQPTMDHQPPTGFPVNDPIFIDQFQGLHPSPPPTQVAPQQPPRGGVVNPEQFQLLQLQPQDILATYRWALQQQHRAAMQQQQQQSYIHHPSMQMRTTPNNMPVQSTRGSWVARQQGAAAAVSGGSRLPVFSGLA